MAFYPRHDAAVAFVRSLGLDPDDVRQININIEPGQPMEATITVRVRSEEGEAVFFRNEELRFVQIQKEDTDAAT